MISLANKENITDITNKMSNELNEKKIVIKQLLLLTNMIIDCIDPLKLKSDIIISYNYDNLTEKFIIKINNKELVKIIPKIRYDFLREYTDNEPIAGLLIKYDLIGGMKGQQWMIPLNIYKQLYDNFHIEVEGFASPFNTQLMLINRNCSYCSIFKSDKIYGSIGSFFKNMKKGTLSNKNIVINPPFINSIMTKVALLILQHKKTVIFWGPNWTDAEFYQLLDKAKSDKIILKRNEYYYETYTGQKIKANFDSVVFFLNTTIGDFEFKY